MALNILQAKQQIEHAVRAYLAVDEQGYSRIPQRMQRPIVMFGPPGVGKTAVVEQVADELDINFVAYSITHHTRQSALGLPYISHEEFDGRDYQVSDYTMSEIIAAVHRARKESGVAEGILFLDEVNCVSETLAPAMLQFLQYKTFGMHHLPEGWIIVCAGNPPEYNRSAREFDPAMLDRIKRIDVEPDLAVWQEYALRVRIHPAITTFLDAKPKSFYQVQADVSGPHLVTARGWEDLARIISTYEAEGLPVDADLVRQYLQDDQVAQEFFAYYELFKKYQDDYKVAQIVEGNADAALIDRAGQASFDERVALVGLLIDAVLGRVHDMAQTQESLERTRADLADATLSEEEKAAFNARVDEYADQSAAAMASIDYAFAFLDQAFGSDSQEALIMVTKLSADPQLVRAVAAHGSDAYLAHNKNLLLSERNLDLLSRIDDMLEGNRVDSNSGSADSNKSDSADEGIA